jgi:hypothetical protein
VVLLLVVVPAAEAFATSGETLANARSAFGASISTYS